MQKHEGTFQLVSNQNYGPSFVTFHRKVNYLTGFSASYSNEDEDEAGNQVGGSLGAMGDRNRISVSSPISYSCVGDVMNRGSSSSSSHSIPPGDNDENGENRGDDDVEDEDDISSMLYDLTDAGLCAQDWEIRATTRTITFNSERDTSTVIHLHQWAMHFFSKSTLERSLNSTLSLSKVLKNVTDISTEPSSSSSHHSQINNISTPTDAFTQTDSENRFDVLCMVVGVIRHKEALDELNRHEALQATSTSSSASSSTSATLSGN